MVELKLIGIIWDVGVEKLTLVLKLSKKLASIGKWYFPIEGYAT